MQDEKIYHISHWVGAIATMQNAKLQFQFSLFFLSLSLLSSFSFRLLARPLFCFAADHFLRRVRITTAPPATQKVPILSSCRLILNNAEINNLLPFLFNSTQ